MATLLSSLQATSLARWVSESPSLLGYPTILVLHTMGLALLVGPSLAIDLRLLGVARTSPLEAVAPLFRVMWIGLGLNAATGALLFMADAVRKAAQPALWIKLLCVAAAVLLLLRIRAIVLRSENEPPSGVTHGRGLAVASILLWAGAIIAGRLMAYL